MEKYISFNRNYILKPDDGKTLIMAALVGRNQLKGIEDSFTNIIHPIYAMILSLINGRTFDECINDAAGELGVNQELVEGFVKSLINNPNSICIKSKGSTSTFPPYTIVSIPNRLCENRYSPNMFTYTKLNLSMSRHLTPSTITLMLNNICVTNCIYCYQDKTRKVNCSIPLNRIIELIHEARQLHVNTFDVIGGEFFLYPHWKEVLKELRKYGYNPYLSTKMPLDEASISFLAEVKVHDIQISLDTLIEEHLTTSLGVKPGYVDNILKSIALLDKYGIPMMIHSVLTQYNDSIEDMQSIYNVIKDLKHLVDWHVVKGDPSLYPKKAYEKIEIAPLSLNKIIDYLTTLKKETAISIHLPANAITEIASDDSTGINRQINHFFSRSFCSGLYSSIYILPDGQVTMCEQLYWNKNFIVGNVLTDSIAEVWNSERAKSIYYIKQEDIPADSLCHYCEKFDACRSVRQVCYREIIRKYGADKWYYPDTSCPYKKMHTNN